MFWLLPMLSRTDELYAQNQFQKPLVVSRELANAFTTHQSDKRIVGTVGKIKVRYSVTATVRTGPIWKH